VISNGHHLLAFFQDQLKQINLNEATSELKPVDHIEFLLVLLRDPTSPRKAKSVIESSGDCLLLHL
jgi:hypothetical protein